MKVIIAGTRNLPRDVALSLFQKALAATAKEIGIKEVVSGNSGTVDEMGVWWALFTGRDYKLFNADWEAHGKAAGPIRNSQMAAYADALIAIWDGKSRGTKHMIEAAYARKLQVFVFRVGAT